jgi:hypothetical protein
MVHNKMSKVWLVGSKRVDFLKLDFSLRVCGG